MRATRAAGTMIAALTLAVMPTAASADQEESAAAPGVAVQQEKAKPGEIHDHWTPERMRQAESGAVPLAEVEAGSANHGKPLPSAGERRDATASADAVLPKNSRLLEVAAAEMSVSERVPYPTSWPNVIVGKLFSDLPDGTPYACTAAVIVSDTKNTVWTAGHCVHRGEGTGDAGWHDNLMFVPGYNNGDAPWGRWEADRKYVPTSWFENSDHETGDMGAVVLRPNADYGNIEDNIGGLGYRFGSQTDYEDAYSYGYPSTGYDRPDSDFNDGENMMYCSGNLEDAGAWNPFDDRLKMDCDMGHGASGGPMFIGVEELNPQLVGTNSHGEGEGDTRTSDDLFSSLHGAQAVELINTVNDSA